MAARASFSSDSRIVKVPLPKSVSLKDCLIDDLSSCSSNGFRSYPRRQCCIKVRYLIEIDLNKNVKLPPKQKKVLKSKSKLKPKSKSSLVLHKASAAVANAFKHLRFSGSGSKPTKANFLPKTLSRKLSKHGFWKRTTDRRNKEFNKRLNSFDEHVKKRNDDLPPPSKVAAAITAVTAKADTSTSNSNSSASLDSYFTITSISSITNSCSKINVAQNDVEECEQHATEKKNTTNGMKTGVATAMATASATATTDSAANGNAKKEEESEKKEQFSPVSVMDFPCDNDEDEVTSPYQHSHLYAEGAKRKLMIKGERIKSLAKLRPVRLEDRLTLPKASNQTEKKAIALLQQLKATMSSRSQFESKMTQNVLLGFFTERIIEGNDSNFALLQEAKDWMNGETRDTTFESQNGKLTYIRDMDKQKGKWSTYDDEVEKRELGLVLECQVFTSLIEEMLLEFYL